eukprot:TRINITY_DN5776_c0_g2_i2.p2 TRINITY_DN5776_c0_g2~~TRINITY_DN5776_c0_g2_i2.p2  ORF type:complete len:234 (+),score=23.64 TRINITY_DN5776_c0_g2_i2:47-748(+)
MSGEGVAERPEGLTEDAFREYSFRVVKISTKRKRQDRDILIIPQVGVVIGVRTQVGARFLTWGSMEGFRFLLGAGFHGAMVVFRCREEPDVCVELQGDSRKPPHEVLAVLREGARQQGLEWTAMPAGTDMAAEAVCRRVGRTKMRVSDRMPEVRDAGGPREVTMHPCYARALGRIVSQLHFFGVVGVMGVNTKTRALVVFPGRLLIANLSGAVCCLAERGCRVPAQGDCREGH